MKSKLGVVIAAVAGVLLVGGVRPNRAAQAESKMDAPDGWWQAASTTEVTASDLAPPKAKIAADEQIDVSTGIKPSTTPVDAKSGNCPAGMVDVEGDYCPAVEQRCLRWLDPEEKMRCAEFAPTSKCLGKTVHKHFCMDKFEYPNKAGEKPVIMKTWYQAKAACEGQGKRLCGDSEWTLACEGQERLPYPYGYQRNSEACNIDKPHPNPDEAAIADPKRRDAEVARLWQGEPSGSRESCVSPYGVHDMTGNVDEWVVNESGKPYKSGLKGGYWGPVRDRCRPMTVAHGEDFSFYQIGFRCCADADGAGSKGPSAPVPSGPATPVVNPSPTAPVTSLTGT
jgi:hypothetical protein